MMKFIIACNYISLKSMSNKLLPDIIRLTNIPGFENRSNDIIYCRPLNSVEIPNIIIFFGGDVQDFTENMLQHRDNKEHVQWNLENTAKLLQSKFMDNHILVVKPLRMEYKTFSCYENFVPCTKCGVPEHTDQYNSLEHLEMLIKNVSSKLQMMTDEEFKEATELSQSGLKLGTNLTEDSKPTKILNNIPLRQNVKLEEFNITLIGFSKGCVVLNQFLYELNYYKNIAKSPDGLKLIKKIKDMYWLDGGHSGGKNTWMTNKSLLENLAELGIKVHVHVTPYQIEDDRRPWIKKEEKIFSETLKKLGVLNERTVHFSNIPPSIQTHFNILNVFNETNTNK